ncbi:MULTISPECIES: type VI secretion system baseplate subunit TssK [unclassified Xanthobacter]|uniref:type VI secretion system baseplate subunit TssK n=1 Tax=unclassified Xanthobacter TaxID=2623496 RepID=UPI001F41D397|nr:MULTISPECIES: type VI secretion system baseplate subunit TssK [unclassified Xanthobacter]
MSVTSKPLWTEGMFVKPQHFQQHDRWLEHFVEARVGGLSPYGWGLRAVAFDEQLLKLGQFALTRCQAVLPDGSVIDIPGQMPPPVPRRVPQDLAQTRIFLALPARAGDAPAIVEPGAAIRRFRDLHQALRDTSAPDREPAEIRLGQLNVGLLFEGEPADGLILLPLARISEVTAAGEVKLSPTYIPPCLDYEAAARLIEVLGEVRGLVHARAEALAERTDPSRMAADSAGLLDLLLLRVMNSAEAVLQHFARLPGTHPEVLFREFVRLTGDLATFDSQHRRTPPLPAYVHDDLEASLEPVLRVLRQALNLVIERNVVPLPLQDRGYGISTATISDRTLFAGGRFVLVASAGIPHEVLRTQFPATTKVGSVEQIRDLVNLQLPGIPLRSLPVAPRELPYLQGAVYFELDQSHELWRTLTRSAAFAFHVSGGYPDLHLEFWAIRAGQS